MTCAIGLDVGGTKIAGAVFSPERLQLAERVVPTPTSYEAFLDACAAMVVALEDETGRGCSIGLGLPGAINQDEGTAFCTNLLFLSGHPLRDDLSRRIGRPVRIANDADCMALAEAVDGAGQGFASVFGLILGTGVGGGFIFQGHIIHGPNGMACEIGHVPLPFREEGDGPLVTCACKQKGCLDGLLSGPALSRLYAFMTGEAAIDPAQIAAKARAGEENARRVLDRYYEVVAKGMVAILHTFDPHIIVVSGGLSALSGLYVEVPKRWGRYALFSEPKTRFVPAVHGPMAGLRGAAWLGAG